MGKQREFSELSRIDEAETQMDEVNFKHLNRTKRWSRVKKGSRVQSSVKPRSTAHGYSY